MLCSSPFCRDLMRVSSLSSAWLVARGEGREGREEERVAVSGPRDCESALLRAVTGAEAAGTVVGRTSPDRALERVAASLLEDRAASERGETQGEAERGRTRAGLGAESRAGRTVATLGALPAAAGPTSSGTSSRLDGSPWRFFSLSTWERRRSYLAAPVHHHHNHHSPHPPLAGPPLEGDGPPGGPRHRVLELRPPAGS